jgi:DNA-directed RNA polymerase subunit E'/Rpb7
MLHPFLRSEIITNNVWLHINNNGINVGISVCQCFVSDGKITQSPTVTVAQVMM